MQSLNLQTLKFLDQICEYRILMYHNSTRTRIALLSHWPGDVSAATTDWKALAKFHRPMRLQPWCTCRARRASILSLSSSLSLSCYSGIRFANRDFTRLLRKVTSDQRTSLMRDYTSLLITYCLILQYIFLVTTLF